MHTGGNSTTTTGIVDPRGLRRGLQRRTVLKSCSSHEAHASARWCPGPDSIKVMATTQVSCAGERLGSQADVPEHVSGGIGPGVGLDLSGFGLDLSDLRTFMSVCLTSNPPNPAHVEIQQSIIILDCLVQGFVHVCGFIFVAVDAG